MKLKEQITNACVFAVIIYSVWNAESSIKSYRVTMAFTILTLITCAFQILFAKADVRNKLLDSYRKGKHLPEWIDHCCYIAIVLPLIWRAWVCSAGAWCLFWLIDASYRNLAKDPNFKFE